ncbi:MAG: CatB-related O-acetyltransferase [Maribacter stanieri]
MILFLKILLSPLKNHFRNALRNNRLINKNNRLKLSGDCKINNCHFGVYNYIENASVNNCSFGDYSYVGSNSYINNVVIGKYTCIGPNVKIGLGEHPIRNFVSIHPVFYSTAKQVGTTYADENYFQEFQKTIIGNDVWIGAGAIIMGGLEIADGAIIAAGAVVTKSVQPYSIVGGVPAKQIKLRFSKEQIGVLMNKRWWDRDEDWLKMNYKKFHQIEEFLSIK